MQKMTCVPKLIFEYHYSVLSPRCSSHILNLMIKDIFQEIQFIITAKEIIGFYRKSEEEKVL